MLSGIGMKDKMEEKQGKKDKDKKEKSKKDKKNKKDKEKKKHKKSKKAGISLLSRKNWASQSRFITAKINIDNTIIMDPKHCRSFCHVPVHPMLGGAGGNIFKFQVSCLLVELPSHIPPTDFGVIDFTS